MKRVVGVEPTMPAWKDGVLAATLYAQMMRMKATKDILRALPTELSQQ